MRIRKNIPSTASVAIPGQDDRLLAPAAGLKLPSGYLPVTGT